MGRQKEGKKPVKKQDFSGECDLDGGYVSPVKTFHDLTPENIKSLVTSSRYIQILIALTTIGIFLRFYNLGYNSLWLDEASTYTISIQSFADIWLMTAAGEFNPPLFYWAEHLMLMLGNNEELLRLLPALFGVLTIPLFYLVGREFFDRNVGIIAAAGCTFSSFLIDYSQEARAYTMTLFFITLATLFFLKAIKSSTLNNWLLFGIFSALVFWTHFYAFVMIAALILYALITVAPRIRTDLNAFKTLIAGVIIFIVLCLPLIVVTLRLFALRTVSAPILGLQGLSLIWDTFYQFSGLNVLSTLFLAALFFLGVGQMYFLNKSKCVFLSLITVVTFGFSYILAVMMPLQPRHLVYFNLVFFIGVACSYRIFYALLRRPAVVYGFIAILCMISVPVLHYYYFEYSKTDWRNFGGVLQEKTNPGDVVVAVPGYIAQPLDYYYSSTADQTHEYQATTSQDLEGIYSRRGNSTIFFVVTEDIRSANPSGDALAWLKNNTQYIGQNTGIYLFSSL